METSSADSPDAVLVRQIGEEHARRLREFAASREVPAGTILIRDAEPVDTLYLVVDGTVAVCIEEGGRSLSLGHLGRGSWLGEVSLLGGQACASSSVYAVSDVSLLEIKHDTFKLLLREQAEMANALIKVLIAGLAERIRASDAVIEQRGSNSFGLVPGAEPAEKQKPFIKLILQKLAGVVGEAGR